MSITIAIPFYNAERFLGDAIRSVFAQTYEDWELILIDDGSTDNSLKIAKSIKDSRVRVYSDGKNKRLAARLNEIAKLAKYDFIARMDADDLISPTRIEKQFNILCENPELDLVTTGVISIKNNLEYIGARGKDCNDLTLKDLLYKRVGIVHAAIIGKKEWFLRNPYNTNLKIAQDYDLWLRSAKKSDFNIQTIKEPLYFYREENNTTFKKLMAAYKNERTMYKRYAGNHFFPLILKSYVKSGIVLVLNKFNKLNYLLNKRSNQKVDASYRNLYYKDLEIIRKTKVPGLKNLSF